MNSSIYIDGIALWVVLVLMVVLTFCAIMLGIGHIKVLKENDGLKIQNRELDRQLSYTQDRLYKTTYKTPEAE